MDIFAHGFWTYAVFNKKKYRWLATLFGVLPDLLSFGPLFAYMLFKGLKFVKDENAIPDYVFAIYSLTHSLIIFFIVTLVVYLILRKFPWPMLGWGLHILIDIPTHTTTFFPTPFLWPISNLRVNGIAWSNQTFMMVNYAALIIFYAYIFYSRYKNKKYH